MPQAGANAGTAAMPQAAPATGGGMGQVLLGAGAGLAGGYLLGNALSGTEAAASASVPQAGDAQPAQAAAGQTGSVSAAAVQQVAAAAGNLLGYDTDGYCTQFAQGDAALRQQCADAEAASMQVLRSCVGMSTGLNGIGSYSALLFCLRATPAAQPAR